MNPGTQVTRLPEPPTFRRIPGQVWCMYRHDSDNIDHWVTVKSTRGRLVLCERWECSTKSGIIVEHRPVWPHTLDNVTQ
jgi:hypothetical protein